MNYEETCEYLFNQTANYESQGRHGYKPGLDKMVRLSEHLNNPHQNFKSIHIAGTNGKGSVCHTLAAQLQVCGYKVGLYTSPHLVDFNERIRVNGQPVSHEYVIDFVEQEKEYIDQLKPTFFEIATAMAFSYFSKRKVDIAIIEVGLGGRLDSTNIITPILSVITNISLDHTALLGSSLEQIAIEKGGIIKKGIPVIIGETTPETHDIFENLAAENESQIVFAGDNDEIESFSPLPEGGIHYTTRHGFNFTGELCGIYQRHNTNTVLYAMFQLMHMGYLCHCENPRNRASIENEMDNAFLHVSQITGLKGRWQIISEHPRVVCDTGHNIGAWEYLNEQLAKQRCNQMHIIFGMVDDKDIYGVMSLLPKTATYYYTKATTKRAIPERSLQVLGQQCGLKGNCYSTVDEAYHAAIKIATEEDFIFIGGSNYIVADYFRTCI